jgi:uncharacterized small protein (DUF1192 family)
MTLFDHESEKTTQAHIVGSDLSQLSVDELNICVDALRIEIARIEVERDKKASGIKEADALFKF